MMPPYMSVKVRQTTTPGTTCPTLYEECVGSLTSHRFITCARAPQLFKDPEGWFGQGLNQRPPTQQAGTYPIELTGRR